MSDLLRWPDEDVARFVAKGLWRGEPLDQMLREHAASRPEAVALVCGTRRASYAHLDARVTRVAGGLQKIGLEAGDYLVLQLDNRLEWVECFFGCVRAGVRPIMALPGHRHADLSEFVRQSGARGYVCMDRWKGFDYRPLARALQQEHACLEHIIVFGDAEEFVPFEDIDAPTFELYDADTQDVALLQLSGGSTGTPKLIPRSHDDYLCSVRESVPHVGLDEASVSLVTLPAAHNFTLSSAGILGALLAGGRVVMSEHSHPDAVFALIEAESVTHLAAVPPLAQAWLRAARGRRFDSVQLLQVGGARLEPELARSLHTEFAPLQQVFGMAEGLVCYTRQDDGQERITRTQGRPMCDADEYLVVDDDDNPVSAGEPGHLLARGPYTVRGYFRAPEHDAERFRSDGFYRTGDIVRVSEQGDFVVTGRAKEQINRGGEKIAPAELERHLALHEEIEEAAVLSIPDALLGERICAAIVGADTLTLAKVRQFLRTRGVAEFKLPDKLMHLDTMPRTKVGKTDKKAMAARLEETAR